MVRPTLQLYSAAQGDPHAVPWADQHANPNLLAWLETQPAPTDQPQALVIGCGLSDDAEAALGQLNHVTTLNLSNNGLTDDQVNSLAPLATLRNLDLGNNPISDAALPPLAKLKQLRTLWLNETQTTEAGRAQLAKELPIAKVDTDKWRQNMFRADNQFLDD